MTKMIVNSVNRTGRSTSSTRRIVVTQGHGKHANVRVLSTEIEKVSMPDHYRMLGGRNVPMEQYAFRVGSKIVERFADAAALVLRRHQVQVEDLDAQPNYVKRAFRIIAGTENLNEVTAA